VTELFVQAFAFVLGAFGLGVAVGWLFWRFRRVSVAEDAWAATNREVAHLRDEIALLRREEEVLAGQASRAAAEVERLQAALTAAWHERDLCRLELQRASGGLVEARAQLERTTAQARYLQRRVTELSIMAARQPLGGDVAPRPALGAGSPNGGPPRQLPR